MVINNDLQKQIEAMNPLANLQKQIEAMNPLANLQKQIEAMNPLANLQKQIEAMNPLANLQKQMEAMTPLANLQKQMEAMTPFNTLRSQLNSKLIENIEKAQIPFLKKNEDIMSSVASLSKPEFFEEAIKAIIEKTAINITTESTYKIENIINDLKEVSSNKNKTSFSANFKKLPTWVQVFIVSIFIHFIIPQLNNITTILLTPHINAIVFDESKSDSEVLKNSKNLAKDLNINLIGFRFVNKNKVRLRSGQSTSSPIICELDLGQIVSVVIKRKNWIKVQINQGENENVTGWVFTRYTSRFKK